VVVTRRFDASPERVFDAWLDPDVVATWMFGPNVRDEEVVRMTIDGRVGGSFSFVVRRQGQEIDHIGEYVEIERPKRMVFTWAVRQDQPDTSRITIDIVPADGGCELTLIQELHPSWADYARRAEEAWAKMLAALARAVG